MKHFSTQNDHALMAALIYKHILSLRPENGDDLIDSVTADYGLDRGRIARENTILNGDLPTLENYFSYKPLRTEDGEFEEETVSNDPFLITQVTKCCWIDTWKKYDLLEHGHKYCKNCDIYMAKGYNNFDLKIPKLMTHDGNDICRFEWPGLMLDEKAVHAKKDELDGRYVLSWCELTDHLVERARITLNSIEPTLGDIVIKAAKEDFDRLD